MLTTMILAAMIGAPALPQTDTLKVLRRDLKRDAFNPDRVNDPMCWRERGDTAFKPFTAVDYGRIEEAFAAAGRSHDLR